jgi:hypothetical protein
MGCKCRNPITTLVPLPPQPSMPGKFHPGTSQWKDVGHAHMRGGHWELAPNPWIHNSHGTSSVPLTEVHLSSHIHIHPGPSQEQGVPFHEMMGPEFQSAKSFGGINMQRPLHFQGHEGDVER